MRRTECGSVICTKKLMCPVQLFTKTFRINVRCYYVCRLTLPTNGLAQLRREPKQVLYLNLALSRITVKCEGFVGDFWLENKNVSDITIEKTSDEQFVLVPRLRQASPCSVCVGAAFEWNRKRAHSRCDCPVIHIALRRGHGYILIRIGIGGSRWSESISPRRR